MTSEPVPIEQEIQLKELELRLREIEVSKELAQLGLRGALTGALAGCLMVIALAVIAAFSQKVQITGTHLCWMMGIVAVAVALYGAFVFNRSLGISGDFQKKRFDVKTRASR
jgi:hypothetical protein